MSDNIIYNQNDEAIGYYSDLVKLYKSMIKERVDANDYDEAQSLMEQLKEIDEWTDNDGLLILRQVKGE